MELPISRFAVEDSQDPVDIEEGAHSYKTGGFHPVYLGETYHRRYRILSKLGYGRHSTVWLVQDLDEQKNEEKVYRALKIIGSKSCNQGSDTFEREILQRLRDGDSRDLGYRHVCHLTDHFEHVGPNGRHLCLVFELMGETLQTFGLWFGEDGMIPERLMRRFTAQLICALDFAHNHNVIHTDIKPDNIFVKCRDFALIALHVELNNLLEKQPARNHSRSDNHYTVIPSQPLRKCYFKGPPTDTAAFDITLGDWGSASWATTTTGSLRTKGPPIQPLLLRSPEVLVGAPWDKTTDLWNLGAVVLEVFRGVRLFDGRRAAGGPYEVRQHLAEMEAFFGPFPIELLRRGDKELVRALFYGDGRVKHADVGVQAARGLEWFVPRRLGEAGRAEFVAFLRDMMRISPAERATPAELLGLPWLEDFGEREKEDVRR